MIKKQKQMQKNKNKLKIKISSYNSIANILADFQGKDKTKSYCTCSEKLGFRKISGFKRK